MLDRRKRIDAKMTMFVGDLDREIVLADSLSCATLTQQVLSRRCCLGRVLQLTSQSIAPIGDRQNMCVMKSAMS